jgi:hypothetical protein
VLSLAREMGLLNVGTLSVDGTKIKANAAIGGKKNLVSLETELEALETQITNILAQAEKSDLEDQDAQGMHLPEGIKQKENRISRLKKAKEVLEHRLKVLKENAQKTAARYRLPASERKRPGKKPNPETEKKREQKQRENQKVSTTDPESRAMPHRKEKSIQGYNAQAGLCTDSRLIVSTYISNEPNDTQQLSPVLTNLCKEDKSSLRYIVADTGYWDGLTLPAFEEQYKCTTICPPKSKDKILTKKYPSHHPRKKADQFKKKMLRRLKTAQGKQLYRRRAPVSEGAFHIIKNLMTFKEFRLRGTKGVATEWDLVCLAANCSQMLRLSMS